MKKKCASWKRKALERRNEIKALKSSLAREKLGRNKLRGSCPGQSGGDAPTRVRHQRFGLDAMLLAVAMHITNNVGLRATAKSLCLAMGLWGPGARSVSATTVRNWSLRVGLYFLTRRPPAGRYVLIADESVSMGREQLLALVAVRLEEDGRRIAPLKMSDAVVLHLGSRKSWKGEAMAKIIMEEAEGRGIELVQAISDKGSNLRNAFALCGLPWVGDCTHMVAGAVQRLYEKNDGLNGFVQLMNATRAKWSSCELAVYAPPGMRKKARFHQILAIHKWAVKILANWDGLPEGAKLELAYVAGNAGLMDTLRQLYELVAHFSALVKGKGVTDATEAECVRFYGDKYSGAEGPDPKVSALHLAMLEYVRKVRATMPHLDQVLCCSDIVESIFGKYKNKGGCPFITDDALEVAAYPFDIQKEDIRKAMETVSMKDILDWKKANTTESLIVLRKKLLPKTAA